MRCKETITVLQVLSEHFNRQGTVSYVGVGQYVA